MVAHHRNAGRGRHHHRLGVAKLREKTLQERHRFGLVAGVEVHLAATGLRPGKVHRMPQPFEQAHHRFAGLGKQRVVVAGDEQQDSHARPPA
jgi:hypothetical protein